MLKYKGHPAMNKALEYTQKDPAKLTTFITNHFAYVKGVASLSTIGVTIASDWRDFVMGGVVNFDSVKLEK